MRTACFTAGLCCAVASAQGPTLPLQGLMHNLDQPTLGAGLSLFIRGAPPQETILNRIDTDDHKDWGTDGAGQIPLQGFMLWITDANDTTQESFNFVIYPEDPAAADLPDLTAPALNVPIQMPPPALPAGQAYRMAFTLTTPINVSGAGDVFVGCNLPAMLSGMPPYDGLFVGSVNNDNVNSTVFDLPGPRGQAGGGIANDSYVCYVINGLPQYLPSSATSLEQLAVDVMPSSGVVGGVAVAQTNQTSYPSSNAPSATGNMLSGLHPDLQRGDNIGFAVRANTAQVPAGSFAFIMMALGPSPIGSIPIGQLTPEANSPDSAGNICIDFTNQASFLTFLAAPPAPGGIANMLEGQVVIPLNAQQRALINSLPGSFDLWWQGFVIDFAAGGPPFEVRTSGCVVQKLK